MILTEGPPDHTGGPVLLPMEPRESRPPAEMRTDHLSHRLPWSHETDWRPEPGESLERGRGEARFTWMCSLAACRARKALHNCFLRDIITMPFRWVRT